VVLALLLVAVGSVGLLLLRQERQPAGGSEKPKPPTNAAPATAAAPVVPVVLLGADCATLGAAGVTSDGAQAYCSRLPTTGDPVWSLYTQVPTPSAATPGPTDESYPEGIEEQVEVCVEETHKTRLQCREDIRRGNITGPA
jgi:serine/threonine-protein kinase